MMYPMQPLPGGPLPADSTGPGVETTEVGTFVALVNLYSDLGNYLGHLEYQDSVWLAFVFVDPNEVQIGTYEVQEAAREAVLLAQGE